MATYAILAAVLAATPLFDGPISTRPVIPQASPPSAPTAQPLAPAPPAPVVPARDPPPSDDYGFVAFCYGAESAFLDLYDQVMPEVERIERAFPGSIPVEQALADYPLVRTDSRANLETYAAALRGAERAAATAISQRGLAAIRQGRQSWSLVTSQNLAAVARAWMGWSPSAACGERARSLAVPATAPSGPGALMASAVDLDRAASAPGAQLASAPQLRLAQTVAPLAPAPIAAAPASPLPTAPGAALGATGLGVSFDDSAPLAGAPGPAATPAAAPPPLVTAPPAAEPDALPWRGVF